MDTYSPQLPGEVCSKLTNLRHHAEKKGFAVINAEVLAEAGGLDELRDFLPLIQDMPAEAYDDEITRHRFGIYAHFYKPDQFAPTLLYFVAPEYDDDLGVKLFKYQLATDVNRQEEGAVRKFAPMPERALQHLFLQRLIEAGFHAAPLPSEYRNLPLHVEIQFIRYQPRLGTASVGTPPTTHQDNDWAFCVFLLEWNNIDGAINAFVPVEHVNKPIHTVPREHILAEVVLTKPLEGYCVEDRKVAHYVGSVHLRAGYHSGRRTIAILSYTPLVPLGPADIKAAADVAIGYPETTLNPPTVAKEIVVERPLSPSEPPGRMDRKTGREPETTILKRGLYA